MDINKVNRVLDLYMRGMYGVDAYLTPSKYGGKNTYLINILLFPSKFLKNSPDFSQKYYDFFSKGVNEVLKDILKGFKYLGINIRSEIKLLDYVRLHISSDSEYLKNYIKELMEHINNFIESDIIEDFYPLSKRMSNVKVEMIDPVIDDMVPGIPYVSLRLTYDSLDDSVDITSLLNEELFRKPLEDYLKTKMNLDPQIDYWFESFY
jgi:hypothetical protein